MKKSSGTSTLHVTQQAIQTGPPGSTKEYKLNVFTRRVMNQQYQKTATKQSHPHTKHTPQPLTRINRSTLPRTFFPLHLSRAKHHTLAAVHHTCRGRADQCSPMSVTDQRNPPKTLQHTHTCKPIKPCNVRVPPQ
jgi:hypothetical protein